MPTEYDTNTNINTNPEVTTPSNNPQPQPTLPTKKSNRVVIIVSLVVLLTLGVTGGLVYYFYTNKNSSNNNASTSNNIPVVPKNTTFVSENYPELKITYPDGWNIDKRNVNLFADDNSKDMVINQIKLAKDNYEIVYTVTPSLGFETSDGLGLKSYCAKNDSFNNILSDHFGRINIDKNDFTSK